MLYHLYMESEKKDINELIYKTEIESQMQETNLWSPKLKGGGGINQEFGINIYTQLNVKYVINRDLLSSIGNYTQYLVITCMPIWEKNLKKNGYV